MAVYKVIEISSISAQSWEDAAQKAIQEVSATVKNVRSVYIKEFLAEVENNRIVGYRTIAKVTFEVER